MSLRNSPSNGAILIAGLVLLVMFQCNHLPKQFTEINVQEAGIGFQNNIVENQHNNILTYEYTYNGGGVAAGDINNDGLVDLYFSANSAPNKMYLNLGDIKFKDISSHTGLEGRPDWKTGVTMCDVNGDGWLDVYVCYSGNAPGEGYNRPIIKQYSKRANQLFINSGCQPGELPTFTDRAEEYGIDAIGTFSSQAYFLDYDRDGDLDMFLLNHANMFYTPFFNTNRLRNLRHPYFGNKLYRNEGNKFIEVSKESGIHGSGLNFGLSASISDLNFDGYPDIYVTNDFEEQDFCYINNKNGTFSERSHTLFGHLSKFSMGSDIADINNDGLQDILVLDMLPEDNYRQKLLRGPDEFDKHRLAIDSGYHHQYMRNTLQINRGFAYDSLPRFSEIGQLAGISNTDWSWSPLLTDFDNDGLKDVFISNGFLRDFTNLDFMKYTGDIYQEAKRENMEVDYVAIIQQLPQTKLTNYIFRNEDGIKFTNQTKDWGFSRKAITNGAAYADLDNDGDQDVIANCVNDYPLVYRNNNEALSGNRYIKIKLKGNGANTYGLGSKIWIKAGGKTIFQEAYYSRGYQSSIEPILTVGVGPVPQLEEVKVEWPDGTFSILNQVATNQQITIEQNSAKDVNFPVGYLPNATRMIDVTESSGINFIHHEDEYVDFKNNRLFLYQLSRLGGKLSIGDTNDDGNDDVYIGGASGQAGALFFGQDNAAFKKSGLQPWSGEAMKEDMGSLFFDADNDHDLDLYVVSGGMNLPHDSLYQDRLYLNNGKGDFVRSVKSLPIEYTSGSCVVAGDYDQDGDQDLFVGGRHMGSLYPNIPRSYLLRNDTKNGIVKFVNITSQINPALENPGMITDALWSDYNNDGWPDLILVGEWMPIRIFINEKGKLIPCDECEQSLSHSNGWWNCIYEADMDEDGDPDYFLGNAGENLPFKASLSQPIELYAGDFNSDGRLDPILCYYIQGESYPMPSRDEMLEQMNPLRKKFIKYEDYSRATLTDIVPSSQLANSYKYSAFTLKSALLENNKGQFLLKDLPAVSQFSSVQGFVNDDLDGDGKNELMGMGNFFSYRAQIGKADASFGFVLHSKNGEMVADQEIKTKTWLDGDIRDGAIVKFKSGIKRLVVSRNNGPVGVYEFFVDVDQK